MAIVDGLCTRYHWSYNDVMALTLADICKITEGFNQPKEKSEAKLSEDQEALIAKARQERVKDGRYS